MAKSLVTLGLVGREPGWAAPTETCNGRRFFHRFSVTERGQRAAEGRVGPRGFGDSRNKFKQLLSGWFCIHSVNFCRYSHFRESKLNTVLKD